MVTTIKASLVSQPPTPQLDLTSISDSALNLLAQLEDMNALQQDLRYLKSKGLTAKRLSRLLNIQPKYLCRWMYGGVKPRSLYHVLVIRECARQIREQEQKHLS